MSLYKIDNKNLVFGLSWKQLTKTNKKQESIFLSETLNCPYGVTVTVSKQEDASSQLGLTDKKEESGSISAAALFSKITQSGVILDTLPDGSFWFCVVNKGEVLNTTDLILSEDELQDSNNPFFEFLLDIGEDDISDDESVFIVSEEAQSVVGDQIRNFDYTVSSFSELLKQKGIKLPGKYRNLTVKKMGAISPAAIGIGFVLIALVVWYFYPSSDDPMDQSGGEALFDDQPSESDSLFDDPEDDESQDEDEEPEIEREEIEEDADTRAIREASERQEMSELYEDFSLRRIDNIISEMQDVNEFLPFLAGGWEIVNVRYSKSNPYEIVSQWDKNFGTPDDFRRYWSQREDEMDFSVRFSTDGQNAQIVFPVDNISPSLMESSRELYKNMKGNEYDPFSLMSDLDNSGYDYQASAASLGQKDEPLMMDNMPEDIDPYQRFLNINLTHFDFSEVNNRSINDFVRVVNKEKLFVANSVRYDFSGNLNWKITGDFYDVR